MSTGSLLRAVWKKHWALTQTYSKSFNTSNSSKATTKLRHVCENEENVIELLRNKNWPVVAPEDL